MKCIVATFAFGLLAAAAVTASAQNAQAVSSHAIREVIREKLKVPPERWEELLRATALRDSAQRVPSPAKSAVEETTISADPLPESEMHAIVNPADPSNILVSAMRLNQGNQQEALLCPIYYSKDGGRSWNKSAFKNIPRETGALVAGGGDPVFAADADGKLYFSWINLYLLNFTSIYMGMFWVSSTDGGVTWDRAANDLIGRARIVSLSATEAFDKQWLATDRTSSPWRNTVYAAMFHPDPAGIKIAVRKKAPDSLGFTQTSVRVSSADFRFVQFASTAVDPQGGLHVTFFASRDSVTFSLYHALSTDGGSSFTAETKVSDVHFPRYSADERASSIAGLDTGRVYPCPHIVADHSQGASRGTLYMTWTGDGIDRYEGNGTDIFFSRSGDNGASWSPPLVVNDDPRGRVRDQFHPSLAVNENGVIAVTWYDRRDDADNMKAHFSLSFSFDGGRSFAKNIPVTSQAMDFASAGTRNSGFTVGEYTQVVMTKTEAIPFWADGRKNDGDLNIMAAFIPIAPVSRVERIGTVAEGFRLDAVHPHPVAAESAVTWSIDVASPVQLRVSDALGRIVAILIDGAQRAGTHRTGFDARALAPGTYYLSLSTAAGTTTRSMVVAR